MSFWGIFDIPHSSPQRLAGEKKVSAIIIKQQFGFPIRSETIVKNKFHNWTSELGCIWYIFGKFGFFQALQHWQQPAAANKLTLVDSDLVINSDSTDKK